MHTNFLEYRTWEEALEAATPKGYENSNLVESVVLKTSALKNKFSRRHSDLVVDLSFRKRWLQRIKLEKLARSSKEKIPAFVQKYLSGMEILRTVGAVGWAKVNEDLRVLDFGGAAGHHYLLADSFFCGRQKLRWNVVETPAMAAAARRIELPGLSFYSDLEKAAADLKEIDLIFASGSLHCCPKPLETLKKLASLGSKKIVVTRTCYLDNYPFRFLLQRSMLSENGPGPLPAGIQDKEIFYPNALVPKDAALAELQRRYRTVLWMKENENLFLVAGQSVHMYGFWGELA